MPHRVEVNPQSHGHLAHGGHLFTRTDDTGAYRTEDLLADLDIDRHTCSLDSQGIQH